jgi:WD40 domain-containing protein
LKLWDISSGRVIRTFIGHKGTITAVRFSQDGHWIVSCASDNAIKLWDTASWPNYPHLSRPPPDGSCGRAGIPNFVGSIVSRWSALAVSRHRSKRKALGSCSAALNQPDASYRFGLAIITISTRTAFLKVNTRQDGTLALRHNEQRAGAAGGVTAHG